MKPRRKRKPQITCATLLGRIMSKHGGTLSLSIPLTGRCVARSLSGKVFLSVTQRIIPKVWSGMHMTQYNHQMTMLSLLPLLLWLLYVAM